MTRITIAARPMVAHNPGGYMPTIFPPTLFPKERYPVIATRM
jgi:hypothetical protein